MHGDPQFDCQLPISFGKREEVGLVIVVSSHLSVRPLTIDSSSIIQSQLNCYVCYCKFSLSRARYSPHQVAAHTPHDSCQCLSHMVKLKICIGVSSWMITYNAEISLSRPKLLRVQTRTFYGARHTRMCDKPSPSSGVSPRLWYLGLT